MQGDDRGALLFEYRPPRAHPILYAGLLVFGMVFVTGTIEALLRGVPLSIVGYYALPLLATAALTILLMPGPARIHEGGIEPGRRLLLRPFRPSFVRWDELRNVYPVHYDVTGAFVSPFASSDGKVTQMGLGLEWPDGRVETVRFTPTRFALGSLQSRGYRQAIDVVRDLFSRQGRPLVRDAPRLAEAEREALLAKARAPFLPFFAIVLLFAAAAPVTAILHRLGVQDGGDGRG
ncbi:MAG TPA: hypothetical protein VFH47_07040, partial [Candidatus Thermoplasmatota archaeon]|nr:hypothetical protein [Candidatus Thermoplasmatota archaeon]